MKAVMVISDSESMGEFERACLSNPDRGFTIFPAVMGRGKTGLKMGDRVHPGGVSLLLTVVPDAEFEATTAFLKEVRDRIGAREITRIFVASADEID